MSSGLYQKCMRFAWVWAGMMGSTWAWGSACEEQVLQQLGWQLAQQTSSDVAATSVCQSANVEDAQAQGLLRLNVNELQGPKRQALLQAALYGQASRCAFQFQVGKAVQTATHKISQNQGFGFTRVQTGWVSFRGGSQAQGWQATKSFGRRYQPLWPNSQAVEAFYTGHLRTECGTGRQMAQLGLLRELFGEDGFDRMFTPSELSIGTFVSLHSSDSILLGRHKGTLFADGSGSKTAALGQQAWLGAPGMIEHVKDKSYLDDISNQAENFVVVAVSHEAQAHLQAASGFAQMNADNVAIWQMSQQITMVGERYFERLLIEEDTRLWRVLPAKQYPIAKRMQALLAQAQYQQFQVYVHPMGVKPVAYHVARLLDRNPRTPYKMALAMHNLPTEIYTRWLQWQLQSCQTHNAALPQTSGLKG